jgi:hypothetical protein
MPGRELLAGFRLVTLGRGLRRARNRPAGRTGSTRETPAAVSPDRSALNEDDSGSAGRARQLEKASVHRRVAIQIAELMQGNVSERDDLRQRLAASSHQTADTLTVPRQAGPRPAVRCGVRSRCLTASSPGS